MLDRASTLVAVEEALVRLAEGQATMPPPSHLLFREPPGDCHVKCGYLDGSPHFVVKIATGFYDNPARGLPVNDGAVIVLDAKIGSPLAIVFDEGWLTSWRTAAAGALAARVLAPAGVRTIGIIGAGHQAGLQLDWLREVLPCRTALVWSRSEASAERFCAEAALLGFSVTPARSANDVVNGSELVVTATPATEPLFSADAVRDGTHITALGADTPGKQELDPSLLSRAALIAVDDRAQCLDHGELGHAVRAGLVTADAAVPLGSILSGRARGRVAATDITVADLTGVAVEDAAVASLAVQRLLGRSA